MPRFGQDGMLVLNVAEKNDAAKSLANIMSSGRFNRVIILNICDFT